MPAPAAQYQPRTWMEATEALLYPMKALGKIEEETQAKWTADQLKAAKQMQKDITKELEGHLIPHREKMSKIRADYSEALLNVEATVRIATDALRLWATAIEESRAKALRALEQAKERAKATGAPQELPQEVTEAPAEMDLKASGLQERTIWQYRVVDFSKVPDTYKVLDKGAIRRAIDNGSRGKDIAGIQIFEEKTFASSPS